LDWLEKRYVISTKERKEKGKRAEK